MFNESCSLKVEHKERGKFHAKLNVAERPIAKKYREGTMKRTLKRGLKVLEIADREVIRTGGKFDFCSLLFRFSAKILGAFCVIAYGSNSFLERQKCRYRACIRFLIDVFM